MDCNGMVGYCTNNLNANSPKWHRIDLSIIDYTNYPLFPIGTGYANAGLELWISIFESFWTYLHAINKDFSLNDIHDLISPKSILCPLIAYRRPKHINATFTKLFETFSYRLVFMTLYDASDFPPKFLLFSFFFLFWFKIRLKYPDARELVDTRALKVDITSPPYISVINLESIAYQSAPVTRIQLLSPQLSSSNCLSVWASIWTLQTNLLGPFNQIHRQARGNQIPECPIIGIDIHSK